MAAPTFTGTSTFVRRYLDAQAPLDVDTLAACRHPDFEIHWPQTAERVPSHDADVLIRTHDDQAGHPPLSTPLATFVEGGAGWQLTGRDAVWIGQTLGASGDRKPCHVVTIIELQAGLVRRETTWVAPSSERPESRANQSRLEEWRATRDVTEVAVTDHVSAARRLAIEAYFGDLSEDPVATHEAFLHPDATEIMPQSRERIEGRDRMIEVLLSHPNFPTVALRRALVIGDTGLAEVSMREADEEFFGIGVFHFRGTKADTVTEYWAPRLDPPPWRGQWTRALDEA